MSDLTHIGPDGRARMVDVGEKSITQREAVAHGFVQMSGDAFQRAIGRDTKKGDPIAIAELAGIMAAKKTADIIPLCHPLALTSVKVDIVEADAANTFQITARVKTTGQTGVEMEALTAVSGACLTLYDMLKAVDKSIVISGIELIEKSGGKSGHYVKPTS